MREIAVAAGILWREGKCLIMRCPVGKPGDGRWEFPGGKLEPGEGAREALVRELAEELGITVLAAREWRRADHVYEPDASAGICERLRVELTFFQVTEYAGEPRPLEGHTLRWVAPREALKLEFLAADRPVLEELAAQQDG